MEEEQPAKILRTPQEIQQRIELLREELKANDVYADFGNGNRILPECARTQLAVRAKIRELSWLLGGEEESVQEIRNSASDYR